VHGGQLVAVERLDALSGDHPVERLGVWLDAEDARCRGCVDDPGAVADSRAAEVVVCQVGDLLWCARALDRWAGHREQSRPAAESTDAVPGLLATLVAVVCADAVSAEALLEPVDRAPVEFDTDCYHQLVVSDALAACERHVM